MRRHFRDQAAACRRLGSPFTAALLELAAERLDEGTAVGRRVLAWPGVPQEDALALRLAGGLHALVLDGRAPGLAAVYPGGARAGEPAALWPAVAEALAAQEAFLLDFLESAPQTNEVGRSAVLAAGFLAIAAALARPLSLLEIGASAGLNLVFDAYDHRLGETAFGTPGAPLRLVPAWRGAAPPGAALQVAARAGCDLRPVDLRQPAARRRLGAYVWPDQRERLARLSAAIGIARAHGVAVEAAEAGDWVERQLARPADGTARVLYHSIVWQYLPTASQARIAAALTAAGAAASADAPLAWLRLEPAPEGGAAELRLTLWPAGDERRLALADFHGRWVDWQVP